MARKFAAELLGTALLVLFGAGAATLVFGFRIFGSSYAAGLVAVALTFGLIYAALVYVIGPISGGHVNPAVTLGAFLGKRITAAELGGYWAAQLIGSILGTLVLWWMLATSPFYNKARVGLGANGYGANSFLRVGGGGAFLVEVVLTGVFVLVVLSLTRESATLPVAGMGIGIALALANMIGIPFDGASVNPARSFGPAIVAGGSVLSQLWLFLIAPLIGGVLAAGVHLLFYPAPASRQTADGQALEPSGARQAGDGSQHGAAGGATSAAPRAPGAAPGEPDEAARSAPGRAADQSVAGRLRQLLRRLFGRPTAYRRGTLATWLTGTSRIPVWPICTTCGTSRSDATIWGPTSRL
jgi:aquaporin Z